VTSQIQMREVEMYADGRMDTKNAARYTGLKPKTLAQMRCQGTGPPFVKRGRVFYYKQDLDEWLREGRVLSTAQARQLSAPAAPAEPATVSIPPQRALSHKSAPRAPPKPSTPRAPARRPACPAE
jgi:hypothetical protein